MQNILQFIIERKMYLNENILFNYLRLKTKTNRKKACSVESVKMQFAEQIKRKCFMDDGNI